MKGERVVTEKIRDVVQQFERKGGRCLVQRHGTIGVNRRTRTPGEVEEIRAPLPIEAKTVLTKMRLFLPALPSDANLNAIA